MKTFIEELNVKDKYMIIYGYMAYMEKPLLSINTFCFLENKDSNLFLNYAMPKF